MLEQIVKEIIAKNGWLNGFYDYKAGDIMAIVNQPEYYEGKPCETKDLKELYSMLKNYQGTFKYRNLLFFNDMQYGTFVYDMNDSDRENYIEHLSMHIMPFEHFEELIDNLIPRLREIY